MDSPKKILITRNRALTTTQAVAIVAMLFMLLTCIAIYFYAKGAWLVAPFAGLELIAVATGFYVSLRHNNDYELVEIDATRIRVCRSIANRRQIFDFQTYWTKIRLELADGLQPSKLFVRSKGRQVELGSWLTDLERSQLAQRLNSLF